MTAEGDANTIEFEAIFSSSALPGPALPEDQELELVNSTSTGLCFAIPALTSGWRATAALPSPTHN